MNLTKYNPNNDFGITTQPNISGLRTLDGEDLCKYNYFIVSFWPYYSGSEENKALATTIEGLAWAAVIAKQSYEGSVSIRSTVSRTIPIYSTVDHLTSKLFNLILFWSKLKMIMMLKEKPCLRLCKRKTFFLPSKRETKMRNSERIGTTKRTTKLITL